MPCEHNNITKILSGNWSLEFIGPGMTFDRYRCIDCNEIGVRPPQNHEMRKTHETIDWHFETPTSHKTILDKIEAAMYLHYK